jgi:Fe(3+) dicitrate transport protein
VLPGIGASYSFTDHAAIYANAHRSFRAPQVWGFLFTGAPQEIDFEMGESYELGTRLRAWHGLGGSVAAWRVDFDNVGTFDTGFYATLGRIVSNGIAVVAEWDAGPTVSSLEGLTAYASWTHQDSELRSGPNAGNETPYAWKDKLAWGVAYETRCRVRFSLGGTYVGPSFSDAANTSAENPDGNLGRNPAATVWDAQVSRTFQVKEKGVLDVALGVTNLFDEEWFVHSRGGFFGGGKVAGPPRQFYASLSLTVTW